LLIEQYVLLLIYVCFFDGVVMAWGKLAEGSFNIAYLNEKKEVFKVAIADVDIYREELDELREDLGSLKRSDVKGRKSVQRAIQKAESKLKRALEDRLLVIEDALDSPKLKDMTRSRLSKEERQINAELIELASVVAVEMLPSDNEGQLDKPERLVRLWNRINSTLDFKARLHEDLELGNGWIAPFISGRQATDEEIFEAAIVIFNCSQRIVLDAAGDGNFITMDDEKATTICVDFGLAIQTVETDEPDNALCLEEWQERKVIYQSECKMAERFFPKTVAVNKALLFIQAHYPDMTNVDFLRIGGYELAERLAAAYDAQMSEKDADSDFMVEKGLEELAKFNELTKAIGSREVAFNALKQCCLTQIKIFLEKENDGVGANNLIGVRRLQESIEVATDLDSISFFFKKHQEQLSGVSNINQGNQLYQEIASYIECACNQTNVAAEKRVAVANEISDSERVLSFRQ
jgi:hypothetical protein